MRSTTSRPDRRPSRPASLPVAGAVLLLTVALTGACGGTEQAAPAASTPAAATSAPVTTVPSTTPGSAPATGAVSTPAVATPAAPAPSATGSTAAAPDPSVPAATTQAAAEVVITIVDYDYDVPPTVAPGATVTVVNQDTVAHTVTSSPAGTFGVTIPGGGTATFTAPAQAGSYPFVCIFHGNMSATLVVG